jgi:hypothetical protein
VSLASPNPGAIFVGTTYKAKSCQKAKNKWEKDKKNKGTPAGSVV